MVEITRMFWKKVVTSDNVVIGETESAELDTSTWQITNIFVGLNDATSNMMGFDRPFLGKVIICLPVSTVQTIKETVVLKKTMKELSEIRECKK